MTSEPGNHFGMDLKELRAHWDAFGRTDPMWAVLSAPDKKFGRWNPDDFFTSGRVEVATVLDVVKRAAGSAGRTLYPGRALDFGCGIGRLTQALCEHFAQCDGVDIAPSMISEAKRWNTHPDRCHYHLNITGDLSMFPDATFDFVYTAHVLQHMEPRYARDYVTEFFRVAAPGGIVAFETVTEPVVGATAALPTEAFRASVALHGVPHRIPASGHAVGSVHIRNTSRYTWPAAGTNGWYQVSVGNHWRDRHGRIVINDDARTPLPADLPPGQSTDAELVVTAPKAVGDYVLSVDLVQEGVRWFNADKSRKTRTRVHVGRPRESRETQRPKAARMEAARMEMYGVPEAELTSWIEQAGGHVIDVIDWSAISGVRSYDWQRRGFIALA